MRSMAMLTLWELSKERNNRVFNKITRLPEKLFRAIQDEAKMWVRTGNRGLEEILPPTGQTVVSVVGTINHVN